MKLGTQIYSRPGKGQKCIQVRFNPDERFTHALNFTGFAYTDHRFQLVKNVIGESSVIVTDNDLIGRDDYIERLDKTMTVVFVFQGNPKIKGSRKPENIIYRISNVAFKGCGASLKRLQAARAKLKAAGIKTKLFKSESDCLNFLNKRGES